MMSVGEDGEGCIRMERGCFCSLIEGNLDPTSVEVYLSEGQKQGSDKIKGQAHRTGGPHRLSSE